MLKNGIGLLFTAGVLFAFTACGESGIDDNKDKNSTTITDIENGINTLSDVNKTTVDDVNISDINTSGTNISDINISDMNVSDINSSMPDGIGHYIDAAVKGVTYDCGNQDGVTDDNGTFTFQDGEKCIFTLGNIVLRELDPDELEDKMIVIENNIDNARLLQTLDNDGNSDNGIEITQNVLNEISASGTSIVPVGDDELGDFFKNIEGAEGYDGAIVSIEEAQLHLAETAKELESQLEQFPTEEDIENRADTTFDGL